VSCLAAYQARGLGQAAAGCPDGERIFNEMIDEICTQMDEAIENQN